MGILKYIADKLYSNDKEVALTEDNGGIESNTNYIKYPDGTMIQWGRYSGDGTTKPFLLGFVGAHPVLTASVDIGAFDNVFVASAEVIDLVSFRVWVTYQPNSGGAWSRSGQSYNWQAIGRWK